MKPSADQELTQREKDYAKRFLPHPSHVLGANNICTLCQTVWRGCECKPESGCSIKNPCRIKTCDKPEAP